MAALTGVVNAYAGKQLLKDYVVPLVRDGKFRADVIQALAASSLKADPTRSQIAEGLFMIDEPVRALGVLLVETYLGRDGEQVPPSISRYMC